MNQDQPPPAGAPAPAPHDRIAPTAHYTAYAWRHLGLPYADLYATRTGAVLFWAFRYLAEWLIVLTGSGPARVPKMSQYLAQRHLVIDHLLAGLNPDRVVEIGAGLSRRGTTWAVDRGTTYIEMDLPAMIRRKRDLIERRASARIREALDRNLRQVAADVMDPRFETILAENLAGAARPAVVAEGLLGYFEKEQQGRILAAVRSGLVSAGGGAFLFDFYTEAERARLRAAVEVLRFFIRMVTRGHGSKEPHADPASAEAFFRAAGFVGIARHEPLSLVDRIPELPRVYAPTAIYVLTARH